MLVKVISKGCGQCGKRAIGTIYNEPNSKKAKRMIEAGLVVSAEPKPKPKKKKPKEDE